MRSFALFREPSCNLSAARLHTLQGEWCKALGSLSQRDLSTRTICSSDLTLNCGRL